MTGFERLKEICREAAHERNACKEGYVALMQTESVSDIMQVWKDNWEDVYESKYADIVVREIENIYDEMGDEIRAAGVYVNEDSDGGIIIISNPKKKIHVRGTARAYVFTKADVTATDNAQVYNRSSNAQVTLRGHSYGNMKTGTCTVKNFAEAKGKGTFVTYNAARLIAEGGIVVDNGHKHISAYGGTRVYSDNSRHIELNGQARQRPLIEYRQ